MKSILNLHQSKIIILLVCLSSLFYCKPDEIFESSAKDILSITSKNKDIQIEFKPQSNSITFTVPYDFDLTEIPVNISISPNAMHSLREASITITGESQIVVTAEDGSTNTYSIEIIRQKNIENLILDFRVSVDGEDYTATIDQNKNEIILDLPTNIPLSKLRPILEISPKATVSPKSESNQNFENTVTYTVTSESGLEKTYKVILNQIKSDENLILSFSFPLNENSTLNGEIDNEKNQVTIEVPFLYEVNAIAPEIKVSDRAQISYESGTKVNFEKNVSFTITAEDGSTKTYTVVVQRAESTENYILSFAFSQAKSESIPATSLDHKNNIISIEVPEKFDLTKAIPTIGISDHATLTPNSGVTQNFEKEIEYTVVSQNGIERVYSVVVTREKSSENYITAFIIETEEENFEGIIDNDKNTITIEVPYTLAISNTTPQIEISPKSILNPTVETPQNFDENVSYIVIAENGTERTYHIIIEREPNPEGIIFEYKVSDENNTYFATIDQQKNVITLSVPYSFDYENAKILYNFSDYATVISNGDNLFNYRYLVISESGNRKLYTVDFQRGDNTENLILSFTVEFDGQTIIAQIDHDKNEIYIGIPYNSEDTVATPIVTVSENASYTPGPNAIVDLSNTPYSVTAQNGDIRFYTIKVEKVKSDQNKILSFILPIDEQYFYGEIDHETNEVLFEIPEGKDISSLVPQIKISKYATLFTNQNESQDFSKEQTYSIVAENDDLRNYTVKVNNIKLTNFNKLHTISCFEYTNFSHWFGGDDRPEFKPRNVGAAQSMVLDKTINLHSFGIYLTGPFQYDHTRTIYPYTVKVVIDIRNADGSIIASEETYVQPSFKEGIVTFNLKELNLLLQKNVEYIFTFYVPDGDKIEVNTGIRGGTYIVESNNLCYKASYSARSDRNQKLDLREWSSWFPKEHNNVVDTHFNFEINGYSAD